MILTIVGFVIGGLIFGTIFLSGLLSAVKGTPVRDVEALGGSLPPGVREPGFREAIQLVSRTAIAPGHMIEMFANGDETYPRLWADLRAARRSITMQMYYCEKGRMAETLREILIERARAGVAVFFLYDAFGSSVPKEYIEALKAGGVQAEPFRPLGIRGAHKLQHRAHIRVVVVDGTTGYTGGFGISDKWYGNGVTKNQWRDSNVRFTGPAVAQLQAAFVACWAETTGHLLVGATLFPTGGPASVDGKAGNGAVAGVLHGSPSVGSTEAERFLTLSIASARERLWITNSYFVPDRDIRQMIAAAARRGVDARVLTAGDDSDVKSTLYAGRARYEELLAAGVRIFEYNDTMMHAKTLVVDGGWAAVGSMNADNRSLSFNEETVLMMLDDGSAAALEGQFERDLAHATEVRLETFRRRGLWERTKEHACHLVWRVL